MAQVSVGAGVEKTAMISLDLNSYTAEQTQDALS